MSYSVQELINHAGTGPEFQRLAGRLSADRLQDYWRMLSEWSLPRRFFLQQSINRMESGGLMLGATLPMLVVLSRALSTGKLDPRYICFEGEALKYASLPVRCHS